jgi:inorganic pyrophosphatase
MYFRFSLRILQLLPSNIDIIKIKAISLTSKNEEKTGSNEPFINDVEPGLTKLDKIIDIQEKIKEGAKKFLKVEYMYLGAFIVVFAGIIVLIDNFQYFTCFAFLLGALSSIASGYIGMYIATETNARVTYVAYENKKHEKLAYSYAFNTAFRGGIVMGFCLVSIALGLLTILIHLYMRIIVPTTLIEFRYMFEVIAGYGLGGSTVALFCRVGGGIYTKAADVGADLIGKTSLGLNEDSPDNPATIADNVGDNVGDIAGMGSDLFGSFAESTCASLVIAGSSIDMTRGANFFWPLLLSASGILVCIITSCFATNYMKVNKKEDIQKTLTYQLIISTLILTPTIILLANNGLPETFSFLNSNNAVLLQTGRYEVMICALIGLYAGLLIGYITEYFTSDENTPTKELAYSCKMGAGLNILEGISLGYYSSVIPILSIAATLFTSFKLAGFYGISIAALGMLSNLSTALAIDAFGPISDNAGGISEMALEDKDVRKITDDLDAAGNTTSAIGKGFAIGSACLVSFSLFGAFITRTGIVEVNILESIIIACLMIGAMVPYAFSALTMRSVGNAADKMVFIVNIV